LARGSAIQIGVGGKTCDIIKSMYTNDCAVKIGKKHNISFHRAVV
jgi:hypothetical protein